MLWVKVVSGKYVHEQALLALDLFIAVCKRIGSYSLDRDIEISSKVGIRSRFNKDSKTQDDFVYYECK